MTSAYSTAQLQALARDAALEAGVPPTFFTQLIQDESSFNPNAVGPMTSTGQAVGIAQFMPGTAQSFGIDPTNPAQSLGAAATYLKQLYNKTGSWLGAANSYGTTTGQGSSNVANLTDALNKDTNGLVGDVAVTIGNQLFPGMGGATAAVAQNASGTIQWLNDFFNWLKNIFSINTAQRATAVVIGAVLVVIALTILIAENKTVQEVVTRTAKGAALVA